MKLSVGPVVNILYLMQFGCIYQLTRGTELTTLKTGGDNNVGLSRAPLTNFW